MGGDVVGIVVECLSELPPPDGIVLAKVERVEVLEELVKREEDEDELF